MVEEVVVVVVAAVVVVAVVVERAVLLVVVVVVVVVSSMVFPWLTNAQVPAQPGQMRCGSACHGSFRVSSNVR